MKVFEEIAAKYAASRPIFKATVESGGRWIEFVIKEPRNKSLRKLTLEAQDPIEKLIIPYLSETLDVEAGKFVSTVRSSSAYKDVVDTICYFYEDNCGLRQPKQSKLHKWIRSMDNGYNHPSAEGFIALYRYIKGVTACSKEDKENVLAILELMRNKYEVN